MWAKEKIEGFESCGGCYKYTAPGRSLDCYVFSRSALEGQDARMASDPALYTNAVYMLVGEEGGTAKAYIGRAGMRKSGGAAMARLSEHVSRPTPSERARYYGYWDRAVVFTGKDAWDMSTILDFEALLIMDTNAGMGWNGKSENAQCLNNIHKYAGMLADAKSFAKDVMGLDLFTGISRKLPGLTREERISAEVKRIIDQTVPLVTIDIADPGESVPEYTTPEEVVEKMLDLLDPGVFNYHAKFIDLSCKGGEFLAMVHDRLLEAEADDEHFSAYDNPFEAQLARNHHIVDEQLYGIAVGERSYEKSRERVYKCKNILKAPAAYIDLIKNNTYQSKAFIMKAFNMGDPEMRFDVVVGNPPYQESTGAGNNGGMILYDGFISAALYMGQQAVMVTKNNWLCSEKLKGLREMILANGLKELVNYPVLGELFPGAGVSVCILHAVHGYDGELSYSEVRNRRQCGSYSKKIRDFPFIASSLHEYSIINKIRLSAGGRFSQNVAGTNPFGISTDGKRMIKGGGYLEQARYCTGEFSVPVLYAGGKDNKYVMYAKRGHIPKTARLLDKYKVICPKQMHKTAATIPSVDVIRPGMACSGQFSVLYVSESREEAERVQKYVYTRFFRFLVNMLTDTLSAAIPARFSLVPMQDFSNSSVIDWGKPVPDIDRQLFRRYGLTKEEAAYICSTIKALK